jgi:hypothetical protein
VLAIDPVNPNVLYVQTWAGIYRTTDGAAGWSAFNLELPLDVRAANLTVPPGSARVYAGTHTNGLFAFHQGASGVVRGVVRNGNTLAPIAGAGVSVDGLHQGVTNGGGEYSYVTTAGVHTVSATALGFSTGSAPTVIVNTWATTSVPDVLLFPRGSTFTNSTLITIEGGFDPATTPYPSIINVSGVRGSITGLAVRVNALVLRPGPGHGARRSRGQAFAFMSDADAEAGTTAAPVTYTFADSRLDRAGAKALQPINWNSADNFPHLDLGRPSPVQLPPARHICQCLRQDQPQCVEAVHISDLGGASIAGGWSLIIVTNAPPVDPRATANGLCHHPQHRQPPCGTRHSAAYAIQWGPD